MRNVLGIAIVLTGVVIITERRAKEKGRNEYASFDLLLMFAATFFSAISQVLLKQSAGNVYKSVIYEYLNWRSL